MSAKRGTYLVTFQDGVQIIVGNNYKHWWVHALEYARWRFGQFGKGTMNRHQVAGHVSSVQFSDVPFVDDGGLKYATPEAYQEIIDELTKKDGKKRMNFKDIQFYMSNRDLKKLRSEIVEW